MKRPVRVANASGFLGDRGSALREMVEGGDVDFVTGDYLAEVTMQILAKQQAKDPKGGYAAAFLHHLEPAFATAMNKGVKIVTNAGGLNPRALGEAVKALAAKLGLTVRVATIHGDDLRERLDALVSSPSTSDVASANAYLGAWGIVQALEAGADIVICPRVTDASLAVGPAAFWHGWKRDDFDRLAGAVAAGHVIECGTQATGGNYSGFKRLPPLEHPGFPLAEIADDGSSVITKHSGTGGTVSIGTVTAQLVYEIESPRYLNPDVVLHVESIVLAQEGPDRVALGGVKGSPPPPTTKVAITTRGSYRNEMLFVAVGLDIDEKIALFERDARAVMKETAASIEVQRIGSAKIDPAYQDQASVLVRVVASATDERAVGRPFSSGLVELALASYPGIFAVTPPGPARELNGYEPGLVEQRSLAHHVILPDGVRADVAPPALTSMFSRPPPAAPAREPAPTPTGTRPAHTRRVPLGTLVDARSGDKGSHANVGVWVESDEAYAWLSTLLTEARFRKLVPEARSLTIERWELPNLRAINFVVRDLLRGGAAVTPRFDRQAKALGEHLRSRVVDVPIALLDATT
jgi:hypothetical protein